MMIETLHRKPLTNADRALGVGVSCACMMLCITFVVCGLLWQGMSLHKVRADAECQDCERKYRSTYSCS